MQVYETQEATLHEQLPYSGYTRERFVAPGTGDIAKVETAAAETQQQVDALRRK